MDSSAHESENQDKEQWILSVSQDVRIRADVPHNWIIEERAIVKKGAMEGKERWVTLGYYSDVTLACTSLFDKHLNLITKEKGKRRLRELIGELQDCTAKITNACRELSNKLGESQTTGEKS